MGKAKRRAVCAFAAGALVAAGVVVRAAAMLPGTVYVAKGVGGVPLAEARPGDDISGGCGGGGREPQ